MKPTPSPDNLDEILIALRPRVSRDSSAYARTERYDALVYAAPSVNLPPLGSSQREEAPFFELPLRGVEHVKISWKHYREYLEAFHDGEKAGYLMRERLFEAVSPGLGTLVEATGATNRRTRIWWSCQSPETEELPWELVLHPKYASDTSFVRGFPPPPRALVPRRGSLKVAVIARDLRDVEGLHLADMADVDVASVSGDMPIREAIGDAVSRGAEILHVIADGDTLASWDGVLELASEKDAPRGRKMSMQRIGSDPASWELAPGELASRTRGSRIVMIGISPSRLALTLGKNERAPTVFRALSHVASAVDTASVVAQLGPWNHSSLPVFRIVYEMLAKTGSAELALREVRKQTGSMVPLALFLRQRLGRELTDRARGSDEDPQRMQVQVDLGRNLLEQLKEIESRYPGVEPISGSAAFREQEERLDSLHASLENWTKLDEGEQ